MQFTGAEETFIPEDIQICIAFYTNTTILSFNWLKISCTVTLNFRYHLVGQVYSLEELKNLTSFSTANDLTLNISVQGSKVTKWLSIFTFRDNQS